MAKKLGVIQVDVTVSGCAGRSHRRISVGVGTAPAHSPLFPLLVALLGARHYGLIALRGAVAAYYKKAARVASKKRVARGRLKAL